MAEGTLIQALLDAQKEINKVGKDGKGYGYKYATLPNILQEVKPKLNEQNILLMFGGEASAECVTASTVLQRGEEKLELCPVRIPVNPNAKNVAQEIGSLMTYARRYSIAGALALELDDDDAAIATRQPNQQPKTINQAQMNTISNKLNEIGTNVGKKPAEVAKELENKLGCAIRQLPINRFSEAMGLLNNWE